MIVKNIHARTPVRIGRITIRANTAVEIDKEMVDAYKKTKAGAYLWEHYLSEVKPKKKSRPKKVESETAPEEAVEVETKEGE